MSNDEAAVAAQLMMCGASDDPKQSNSSFSKLFQQALRAKNGDDDDVYCVEYRPF